MAATVTSVAPPMGSTLGAWTAPDLRLVPEPQHTTAAALAIHYTNDLQALRTEAFRWLHDLSTCTTP